MRHGKKLNSLGRKSAHRKAMLANMSISLIEHKRITTTVAKAKALRVYLEPLLTKAKTDSTHTRRVVFSYLQDKDAITELFREIAPKIADRPGGYLRIIRLGNRLGDNAEMCMIELVDFNELMVKEPKEKRTRRSRRGGGAPAKAAATTEAEDKQETPVDATAKTEVPKKTTAKAETPKKEAPKKEATAKKETPKKEDTPKKEAPKKEAPKAEKKKSDEEE